MNFAKASSDTAETVGFRKQQGMSDMSVLELSVELTRFKAPFVYLSAEKLDLSTKLGAVGAESDNRLKELAVVRGGYDPIEGSMRSIVGQSVEAINAFVNHVGTQLVDRFPAELEKAYAGCQSAFHFMWTHVSGVGATSVEM